MVIPVAEIAPDWLESYAVSPDAARDALEGADSTLRIARSADLPF